MDFIQILPIIIGVIALAIGIGAGKFLFARDTRKQVEEAAQQAEKLIADARTQTETLKKEKMLEAKEKFVQLRSEHEKDVLERNKKINDSEIKIKQKEQSINSKLENLDKQARENDTIKENLNRQIEVINQKRTELEKHQEEHIRRLEKIAGLTADEAKTQLVESLRQEAHSQAITIQQEIIEDAKQKANKEARKIIIQSIQRTAAEQTIENTVTVFNLESDEIKGQIIGREGRNIRAIEAATGVDLIVDDTPEAIVLSSFDPLRREIARLSLQRLVADGRIHPARIEEVVEKTRKQIEEQVMDIGERAVIELGIHGLHKELVRVVGKMRFRSSYGQNLLMHSREVANLCGIMAAELGMNAKSSASLKVLAETIAQHISAMVEQTEKMRLARKKANEIDSTRAMAQAYCDQVKPYLESIRDHADRLEILVDNELWPLPKYRELLFLK